MKSNRSIFCGLFCLIFSGLTPAVAQETDAGKLRWLHLAAGLLHSAERDQAYSPLSYQSAVPAVLLGYRVEKRKKSELLWIQAAKGELSNRFGARMTVTTVGLINFTFYHAERSATEGFHFGWSNNNVLSLRDFRDAGNFSPRFDYHTSFGPAVRWRYIPRGSLSRFCVEAVGHFQVIGFMLQSGYVVDAPGGAVGTNGFSGDAFRRSVALFYPLRNWDGGLWWNLRYTLPSGNSLSFAYRYDLSALESSHRSVKSRGLYLLTINTRL